MDAEQAGGEEEATLRMPSTTSLWARAMFGSDRSSKAWAMNDAAEGSTNDHSGLTPWSTIQAPMASEYWESVICRMALRES